MDQDLTVRLRDQLETALTNGTALVIHGRGTKSWLGRAIEGQVVDVSGHRGILNYQPKELVLTARAGTPLREIEETLAAAGQRLPFEPPHFACETETAGASLGGTIAAGLSGPARPYSGAARDLVLGVRILNGHAQVLRFGGEVMKNVAGYDISRLMVGAHGTLGILLDVSLKVMPMPAASRTLVRECALPEALEQMNDWARKPLPVTATCYDGERLWVRLAGAVQGVREAVARLGGESLEEGAAACFWRDTVREQRHTFFAGTSPLWRLSLPPAAPLLDLPGPQFVEWSGMQRWLRSEAPVESIRARAASAGGHATLFRGGDRVGDIFHPLPSGLMSLHRRIKAAFDPRGILNPGRMYPGF